MFFAIALTALGVFVEAESFERLGGWTVETQSVRNMGSAYVMAHGLGVPVADAETTVEIPEAGEYEVWARTRNWVEEWRPGRHPGRFRVVVNDVPTAAEVGTNGREWAWQAAGRVTLPKGKTRLALRDLTGFNGRCDAVAFVRADGAATAEKLRLAAQSGVADAPDEYDLIVCGGGVAGTCAALSAARYGLRTLLLQDRAILGGCNSSEVRVSAGGYAHVGPYPALGNVLDEILPIRGEYTVLPARFYEDDRKALAFERPEFKAKLKLNQFVYAVEKDAAGRLVAVVARDMRTGRATRFCGKLFVDATGDGTIARLAGCETMYGREDKSRWDEACAPEKADRQVMGQSIQWTSEVTSEAQPFPDIDWGLAFDEESCYYVTGGSWWQEAGQLRDMADETEIIRDYGLLAIFSNWSFIKNHGRRRTAWARRRLTWMSPIGGKRESHRVVGDYVMTENDLENHAEFADGTAAVTWDIDLHFPDPDNMGKFGEPFLSCAYHRWFGRPVAVPYRCLYARDAANLFLAGRDVSVSHGAFAAVRVQRTLGMLGEVVGIAAGICGEKRCTPRQVYAEHLDLLRARMAAGVPKLREYVAFTNRNEEKYHFHDLGFVGIWPPRTNAVPPRAARVIRSLGMDHRHRYPVLDGPERRRVLVLADESRAQLHYYDSANPAACFAIPGEKPMWDLKKIAPRRYRTVVHKGFMTFDLDARQVVDIFRHPALDEVTAVCDLPDGGFVASVNPVKGDPDFGKTVLLRRFDAARRLTATYRVDGCFYARSLQWDRDGKTLLLAWEKGFARVRLPATGERAEVVDDFRQPQGRNLFDVVPRKTGTGYLAGCGYGGGLVHFDAQGHTEKVWTVPERHGKKAIFYAQTAEQDDGHVYLAHWTGHGADDSHKGWQVVEFDADGHAVWHLDSPDIFGSVSGIVIEQ